MLSREDIRIMVRRMAYQVFEKFGTFERMVILGVNGEGLPLARLLKAELDAMGGLASEVYTLNLEKHQARRPAVTFSPPLPDLDGMPVLLVDDVLNSGRTLTYALAPLMEFSIPCLHIAVLVERTYRTFPVSATITGLALSTTLEEHVVTRIEGPDETAGVFLTDDLG